MPRLCTYSLNVIYLALIIALSPLLLWAILRKGKYREGYGAKLLGRVPRREGNRPSVWLHAVSAGEVNVLRTLVAEIAERRPDLDLVISTTTKTGFDLAQKRFAEHTVFYCPLDFSWAVRAAIRRIRPSALVLAELELWPNLIAAAKEAGAAVAIVNGRLGDNSFRGYRRIRRLVVRVLRMVDIIAAKDDTTAERFRALGARAGSVHVTGSLKYDGAETDRNNSQSVALRELAGIADRDVVLLAGSTQAPEEAIALQTFQSLVSDHPQLKLVLVPRHPERFDEVAQLLDANSLTRQRRSELPDCQRRIRNGEAPYQRRSDFETDSRRLTTCGAPPSVLLVDTVGELGGWWGTATIAFVGGSFGDRGGQNMIEPAAYGVATSFGPNTWNFRDIVKTLLDADAAIVVQDGEGLTAFVRRCLEEPEWAVALGDRGRALVTTQLGATERTVDLLTRLPALQRQPEQPSRSAA